MIRRKRMVAEVMGFIHECSRGIFYFCHDLSLQKRAIYLARLKLYCKFCINRFYPFRSGVNKILTEICCALYRHQYFIYFAIKVKSTNMLFNLCKSKLFLTSPFFHSCMLHKSISLGITPDVVGNICLPCQSVLVQHKICQQLLPPSSFSCSKKL